MSLRDSEIENSEERLVLLYRLLCQFIDGIDFHFKYMQIHFAQKVQLFKILIKCKT